MHDHTPAAAQANDPLQEESMNDKPLLLLDVDGVLNAFPPRPGGEYSRHLIDGYRIHFHAELPAMVSALEEVFEIVWFTLWNHRATPGIGPHVGLDQATHLTTSWERGWEAALTAGYDSTGIRQLMYAKTPLLPELVGTQRPWVWIDDAHSVWDQEYLVNAGMDPSRFRLVRTDPEVGLMWDDVEEAIAFARTGGTADARDVFDSSKTPTSNFPGSALGRREAATSPTSPTSNFPGSVPGRRDAASDDDGARDEADLLVQEFAELLEFLQPDDNGVCPRCGGVTKPVVYGYPSGELLDQADRGEVFLGGCCPPVGPAGSRCTACGHNTGSEF